MKEALKLALEALDAMANEGWLLCGPEGLDNAQTKCVEAITAIKQALAQTQEPVACDGDFPEGFDKSLDIPAQALRQANAALCEVTNNRMWDVPALAERMLMFCRNTHPPQRKPLTKEDLQKILQEVSGQGWEPLLRAIEAAHGIKE